MNFLSMLQALIASNSISSVNADVDQGNREVIDILANWLDDLGFATEVMPLADPRKANLIATLGTGPGGLVLAGHTDTVPCDEGLWQQSPFKLTERDNRFYGLGAVSYTPLTLPTNRDVESYVPGVYFQKDIQYQTRLHLCLQD